MTRLKCDRLVLATGNPHKVRELSALLATLPIPLIPLSECPGITAVDEVGASCAEIARQKAAGYARQLGQWVLADDTALEVDALGGAPGTRSARYAGDLATMADNRAKLLRELEQVPLPHRTARFVCHLALADPSGTIIAEASGACAGRVRCQPAAGTFGFGYDSLFEVAGDDRTLAELDPQGTAAVGHRGHAARALLRQWQHLGLHPHLGADPASQSS